MEYKSHSDWLEWLKVSYALMDAVVAAAPQADAGVAASEYVVALYGGGALGDVSAAVADVAAGAADAESLLRQTGS